MAQNQVADIMPNHFFKFKQFTVFQDRCAMKVGTDGVLLGAWTDVEQARRVLDIGTGTGLIALMAAQRSRAEVCGVEVDEEAAGQACENADASPWKDRIRIICKPVQAYADEAGFDVIVSNPPYFQEQTFCPDSQRNGARHTDGLSFEELLEAVSRLLTAEGVFYVVLPAGAVDRFVGLAAERHLYPCRHTRVHTKPDVPSKRSLLGFSRCILPCREDSLVVELERHVYSPEYIRLTRDFYLAM